MKIFRTLIIALIYHSAHAVGMVCVEGESEFHGKEKIQHCVNNNLTDVCTIDWTTINAVTACSRLTVSPSTVTSCTHTITKTKFISTLSTVIVTSTERVSQCPSSSEATPLMTTQQQLLLSTNSVSRSTSSLPRPSLTSASLSKWPSTSDTRSIHQSTASFSRLPSSTGQLKSTYQTTTEAVPAVTSRTVPRSTAGQPKTMITPTPTTSQVVDQNQDQRRLLMCSITTTTMAIVSGALLLCLTLSFAGWIWTCCMLRRMRAHKQNTLVDQRPKQEVILRSTKHKFQNPIYEANTAADVHTYHTDGQKYETVMPGSQGYETVLSDDKSLADAREHKFTVKTGANSGPCYHVLEKPLLDHDLAGLNEPNGEDTVDS